MPWPSAPSRSRPAARRPCGLYPCAATKAAYQDQLDSARLRHTLGYAGVGSGVATAAVGAFFALTADPERYSRGPLAYVGVRGEGAAVVLGGRF